MSLLAVRSEMWRVLSAVGDYTNPGPSWCKLVGAWNAANTALERFGRKPLGSLISKDWYNPASAIALGFSVVNLPAIMVEMGSFFPWNLSWESANTLADRGEMLLKGALLFGKGGERVSRIADLCGIVANFSSMFFVSSKPFVAGSGAADPSEGGERRARFERLVEVRSRVDRVKAFLATAVKVTDFIAGKSLDGRSKTCFAVVKAASSALEVGAGIFGCYVDHVRTKPDLAR